MFHALHKVDMRACYAKQKINLGYPYMDQLKLNIINLISAYMDYLWK